MRFERLSVPAFGPFTGLNLDFPAQGPDLHLIYGPNEAGKSSLLRAVRDLLYGIDSRTPDNFLHEYRDLRIQGAISAPDGSRLTFQRRKGNKDTLLDETGAPIPEETLHPFLGRVDRDFFITLFGLGATELHRGAEALLQGKGALGQALFSAGLAATPVHRILADLEQEAAGLFQGRATVNVRIRPAVKDYKDVLQASRTALVRPQTWETTLEQSTTARDRQDCLSTELTQRRTRLDWVQRCLDALPTLGRLREWERRLAALPVVPPTLDADFVAAVEQALGDRERAEATLQRLDDRIARFRERLHDNRFPEDLLAHSAEIETLHGQVEAIRRRQSETTALEADMERAEADLRATMRDLAVDTPETVASLRIAAADEAALVEAANALEDAEKGLRANRQAAEVEHGALARIDAKLGLLPERDVSELRALLLRTEGAAQAGTRLGSRQMRLVATQADLEADHGLLRDAPTDHRQCFELPVPDSATLRRFGTELDRLELARTDADTAITTLAQRIRERDGQLERLQRQGDLPSPADLGTAREHRDQGWQLVRNAWRDGTQTIEWGGLPLSESYPRSVARADRIADRLREDAETVARAEELRLQLAEARRAETQARERREQTRADHGDWQSRWRELWAPCGIAPRTPDEMIEWRDRWTQFRDRHRDWQRARDELEADRGEIHRALDLLAPEQTEDDRPSLEVLREEVERKVREADQARGARTQLQAQRAEHQADLDRLLAAQPGLLEAERRTRALWRTRCAALDLPNDAGSAMGLALLGRRKQLIERFDLWTGLRGQIQNKRREIQDFQGRVQALGDRLKLPAGAVEVREHALWTALEDARERRARHRQAKADLEREKAQRPAEQRTLDEAKRRIADHVAASGSRNETSLRALLGDLRTRFGLRAEIEQLRRTLHIPARGEPLETFIARVGDEPAEPLAAERDALQRAIADLDRRRDQAVRDLAEADGRRRALEQSGSEAAEALQMAQHHAARIRRDAGRYVRLQLARHLLREQIEAFRKRHQAPLLRRAGTLFRAMTRGSFEGLDSDFAEDDSQVLVGMRDTGKVRVDGMSDGTRDQLYLALRLAAIERHLDHHPPMPLILDDLLVTFDDRRALALLPLLRDLSAKTQVMLFSHHRHLLDLARQALTEDGFRLHRLTSDGG